MEANITVDVQDYRLVFPNGQSTFVLQSPVWHGRDRGGMILVRQDQGANINEVSFKRTEDLVRSNDPPHGTYAHGILLQSHPGQRYLKGDLVWLRDLSWKPGANLDQSKINVVNLRTWEDLVIDLHMACWVPKYRKLDHLANEEEVLTISGPPKRNSNDKKLYVLAIVQRLSWGNQSSSAGVGGLQLQVQELMEKDLFKYQNLSISPDGRRTAETLFHWAFTSVLPSPTNEYTSPPQQRPLPTPPTIMSPRPVASEASGSGAPPADADNDMILGDENDSDFDRDAEELWAKGMAVLNKRSTIIEPKQICNLPKDKCPTPPRTFFVTNRPSVENPYPTHHHRLDHECPIGAAHEIHCVFPSSQVPLCIIPCTIKHQCCTTGVWPRNKSISKPSTVISLPVGDQGRVVVRGGSGVTRTQPDNSMYADLPITVKPMGFDATWNNDEVGRRAYGVGEREDVVDGEWNFAAASLEGTVGDLNPGEPGPAPVSEKAGEESGDPDVFGDRHFLDE